jgi:hypothetical protein
MLAAPLLERTRGLAFEVGYEEIVFTEQNLAEVIIAVVPCFERGARRHAQRIDAREHLVAAGCELTPLRSDSRR